jgi:hypothetical protein
LDKELKEAEEIFQGLIKKHATKDDSGNVKMEDGNFEIPDEEVKNWEAAMTDFGEHEITVQRNKIQLDDLVNVKLTPTDLKALGPVLDLPSDLH